MTKTGDHVMLSEKLCPTCRPQTKMRFTSFIYAPAHYDDTKICIIQCPECKHVEIAYDNFNETSSKTSQSHGPRTKTTIYADALVTIEDCIKELKDIDIEESLIRILVSDNVDRALRLGHYKQH